MENHSTQRPPVPTPQGRERESLQTLPPTPKPTYADVVTTHPAAPGGYTTSSRETSRPQRNRQPPASYGSYVTH